MDDTTESVALLLLDRTRIENVLANNVVGRVIKSFPTNTQISFYPWEMGPDEQGIIYGKDPDVIYIIKNDLLTEEQKTVINEIANVNK